MAPITIAGRRCRATASTSRTVAILLTAWLIAGCGAAAGGGAAGGGAAGGGAASGGPPTGGAGKTSGRGTGGGPDSGSAPASPAPPAALPAGVPLTVLDRIRVAGTAWGLVAAAGALFALVATNGKGTAIVRVDPVTGRTGPAARVAGIAGVAGAGGLVWVVRSPRSARARPLPVLGLSPVTLKVERSVAVPNRPAWGADDAAAAGGLVWVAGTRSLMAIDPVSGRLVRTVPLAAAARPSAFTSVASDPAGTSLWTAEGDGGGGPIAVQRRDPRTGAVLAAADGPVAGLGAARIAALPGHAWLAYATGMEGSYFRASVRSGARPARLSEAQPARGRAGRPIFSNGLKTFLAGRTLWILDGNLIACAADTTGRILSRTQGSRALFSDIASLPLRRLAIIFNGYILIARPNPPCAS